MIIDHLMNQSNVSFGTSGIRGLVKDMSNELCYNYTIAFLQYLENIGDLNRKKIAIAGDLRPSTNQIMSAVSQAISDKNYEVLNCGNIPTPALFLFGKDLNIPSIMVTGSHIPADRNGIKFNTSSGEILKSDEVNIRKQVIIPKEKLFINPLPKENTEAKFNYINRYLKLFPKKILIGMRIGVYQHSAVGRDILVKLFSSLGAEVFPLGFSDSFIPVDTEAIRDEDRILAKKWANELNLDTIISTDGDGDRPLISDENGEWIRGDILGIFTSLYLKADSISTPISSNTALELCNFFPNISRTRIGSPYVIKSMQDSSNNGFKVVGYEANGGFLTNSSFEIYNNTLSPLLTRDAILPILCLILLSKEGKRSISEQIKLLPKRFTYSNRVSNLSKNEMNNITNYCRNIKNLKKDFASNFGNIVTVNKIDGIRLIFEGDDILHIRPSGNAPEYRFYSESNDLDRAKYINQFAVEIMMNLNI